MNRREFLTAGGALAAAGCVSVRTKSAEEIAFDEAVATIDATTPFDEERRAPALAVLQKAIDDMGRKEPYLDFVDGGLRLSEAAVEAAHIAYPPLKWYDHAFEKVLRELKETKVTGDVPAVWYLYNMGIVVKTKTCAFAVDVCHRQAERLVPLIDFALCSHNHDDHHTQRFLTAMQRAKKPVVSNFCLCWDWYFKGSEQEIKIKGVTIRCTETDHNAHLKNAVMCFEILCGEGASPYVIFHSGDSHRAEQIKCRTPHADLFFGHCMIGFNFPKAYATTMPAKLVLPVHHQELGHLGGPWRCVGFPECAGVVEGVRKAGARAALLAWGDRVV